MLKQSPKATISVKDVTGREHSCEFYIDTDRNKSIGGTNTSVQRMVIIAPEGYKLIEQLGCEPVLVQVKEAFKEFNPRCCQPEYCKKNAPEDYYGAFCRSCER